MPSGSRLCKENISPETVGSILQAIADLLATATSETFSLTLPIGPASRTQAGVMTAEDYILLLLEPIGQMGSGIVGNG